MAAGRPSIYSEQTATSILLRLASGEPLKRICQDADLPCRDTVLMWVVNDTGGFSDKYARAREAGAHALVDDLPEIVDDGQNDWMATNDPENPGYRLNGEHVQRARLRVDARKWMAAKFNPRAYGDKVTNEHTGPNGGPIQSAHTVIDAKELTPDARAALRAALVKAKGK